MAFIWCCERNFAGRRHRGKAKCREEEARTEGRKENGHHCHATAGWLWNHRIDNINQLPQWKCKMMWDDAMAEVVVVVVAPFLFYSPPLGRKFFHEMKDGFLCDNGWSLNCIWLALVFPHGTPSVVLLDERRISLFSSHGHCSRASLPIAIYPPTRLLSLDAIYYTRILRARDSGDVEWISFIMRGLCDTPASHWIM